jgi:hypothetical protein
MTYQKTAASAAGMDAEPTSGNTRPHSEIPHTVLLVRFFGKPLVK